MLTQVGKRVEGSDGRSTESKDRHVTGGGRPAGSARLADTEIYSSRSARESVSYCKSVGL
ncbi:hypothetical protein BY996DRAFT_6470774 [Phakopsora pachyrhizi]|nr:hypothetical protein BY996DRAFT_6470774 [Phakopsora pachyrhizi]